MSDDLVKRLRWLGDHASFEPHMHHTAASRIEKLEAVLRDIIDRAEYRMGHHVTDAVCAIARNALEGKDE